MSALFPFIVLQVFCSIDRQLLLRLSWLLCKLSRAIPCCIFSIISVTREEAGFVHDESLFEQQHCISTQSVMLVANNS